MTDDLSPYEELVYRISDLLAAEEWAIRADPWPGDLRETADKILGLLDQRILENAAASLWRRHGSGESWADCTDQGYFRDLARISLRALTTDLFPEES